MQQLLSVWAALDNRRRAIVVLATVAVFAAVLGLARLASSPSMTLLYAGLEPGPAGEVLAALDQRGVTYEVRGGTIFVDSRQRDQLRLNLASEGLPANGNQGYELLDALSGFGTTAQMFDAAYWRAKEGELSRTILANPQIQSARVHIAAPSLRPFSRGQRPSASVTITASGGPLNSEHGRALRYLVASAVAGMEVRDVSVIDARTGTVLAGDDMVSGAGTPDDRAESLRQNVERLLAARVGLGAAVVEVSVDTVTESEQITERRFDPDSRVAISSETEESSSTAQDQRANNVTVASNLPTGDDAGPSNTSNSSNTETRERVNFEVSETTRELVRQPGAVKRVSVAVLVDGLRTTADDGTESWEPRSEEELASLKDLVASAVGFDEARGDVITIRSMQFDVPPEPIPEAGGLAGLDLASLDMMSLIQIAVLALVALILGLFVIRPVLANTAAPRLAAPPAARPALAPVATVAPPDRSLDGEIDDEDYSRPQLAPASGFDRVGIEKRPSAGALTSSQDGDDPVRRLRQLISDRQGETVEILRNWMEEPEETR